MMKRIFITLLLCSPMLLLAQSSQFSLSGQIGELNPLAKAYLLYSSNDKTKLDSAVIQKGVFNFKGQIEAPIQASIVISHDGTTFKNLKKRDALNFYIEPGSQQMSKSDSVAKAVVLNSTINDEYIALNNALKSFNKKKSELYTAYYGATEETRKSEVFNKQMAEKDKQINLEGEATKRAFVKAHPNSLVSLDVVKSIAGPVVETSIIQPLFESLTEKVKKSVSGKKYAEYLKKLSAVAIGAMAPEIIQPDTVGKMISLSSYRGKYVLIDFWASWCKPCREENPNLRRDYARFHPKGFEILGVSLDQPNGKAAWIKAIHDDQLSWAQVSDLKYWKSEVAEAYSVRAIPQSFLIGPDGKIVAKNLRGDELTAKLEEIFGK